MAIDLQRLRCPYSGKKQTVRYEDRLLDAGFYVDGGFDPAVGFVTKELAEAALRCRNGAPGKAKQLKCPYTGNPITVEQGPGGLWYATGDFFRPRQKREARTDVFRLVTMRGGKAKFKESDLTVIGVREEMSDPRAGMSNGTEIADTVGEFLELTGVQK